MDPRRPGPGKRVLPPGAVQSPQRRRRTAGPQDSRVVQASQSFGNMSLVSTSYGQPLHQSRPSPPSTTFDNFPNGQPPMPGYGHAQNFRLSRLDAVETTKLWNAVASGLNFQNIKDYIFSARRDLTVKMLEDQAKHIGAGWEPPEDLALLQSGIKENSSHNEIVRIREKLLKSHFICPTRSVDDIRVHFAYLMAKAREDNSRNPPAGGHARYGYQNQFTHNAQSYITGPTTTGPVYPSPGPYAAEPGPASRGPGGAGPWPPQHHGAPRPMPKAFHSPQVQHSDVHRMSPGYGPSDGSEMGSPTSSDDGWQSLLVDDWKERAAPSARFQNPSYTRTQGRDVRQATPPVPPGSQSRSQRHIGRRASPAGTVDPPRRSQPKLSKEDQDDIRVLSAGGLSLKQISEIYYPDINPTTLASSMVRSAGWRAWSKPQNDQVLHLHKELRDNWALISSLLDGEPRIPREVEARVKYLEANDEKSRSKSAGQHRYTYEEDMEIRRQLAQGHRVTDFASEFPHVGRRSLYARAVLIDAKWRDADDSRLIEMVGQTGTNVNWDAIGRRYTPRRTAEIVEMRWRYLQARGSQ